MPAPKSPDLEPSKQKAAERVYCTYCGKGFSRKEHLERHLPTHTNVKPHCCSVCRLGFSRRDLLQRHFSTYHEHKDPMGTLPGGLPPAAGRTPIACQNCASAKTGCDKKVPCTRCSEKNLVCEARFARRSSKAAMRAAQATAQASGTFQNSLTDSDLRTHPPGAANLALRDASQAGVKAEGNGSPSVIVAILGARDEGSPSEASPLHHSQLHLGGFPSPHTRVDSGLEDFMPMNNDFTIPEAAYQDFISWPEIHMDLDSYQCTPPLGRPRDMSMAGASAFSGIPSPPEAMMSSSRTSNTPGTDMMSVDYELGLKASDFAMAAPVDNSIPEFDVVLVAEGAWNFARCNPPTFAGNCPRTAIVHLECLEQKSKHEGTWSALEKHMEQFDWDVPDLASVVPLSSRTRDKMLAITQSFLHKALDIHRGGHPGYSKHGYSRAGDCDFIVLPPSKILECFLRNYVRSLSVYYPLVAAGCVDPNEMLQNNQASTLLVLLMIAQGAATMPIPEARHLSAGLTETCRISLFDIVEKDVELSADPTALRCALLFIVLGSWSGDKWLMDIAMGQRGMYMSMLKHAGMLEPKTLAIPEFGDAVNIELQWRAWVQRETRNRLVYNYVMLDQELSLFHDTAPLFAITELQCPLPAPEVLWMSTNSEQWFTAMQSLHDCAANVNPQLLSTTSAASSLYELFQDFLQDNLLERQPSVSPQQLRLILHPLQAMIYHFRQMISCFSTTFGTPHANGSSVNRSSMLHRLDEMHVLLQRWYDITMSHSKENPGCPITRCNLILYHLVYLNAITDFPEIERLARREGFGGLHWELSMRHAKCIFQRQKAIIHCGQVIRLLRTMPKDRRPVWWSAAMYRAMLILWADSISRVDPDIHADKHGNIGVQDASPVMIDQLTLEDPAIINYMWSGEGTPVLVRPRGSPVAVADPSGLLGCAVKNIETCYGSRIGDGIKRKLITLGNNWNLNVLGGSPPGGGC